MDFIAFFLSIALMAMLFLLSKKIREANTLRFFMDQQIRMRTSAEKQCDRYQSKISVLSRELIHAEIELESLRKEIIKLKSDK